MIRLLIFNFVQVSYLDRSVVCRPSAMALLALRVRTSTISAAQHPSSIFTTSRQSLILGRGSSTSSLCTSSRSPRPSPASSLARDANATESLGREFVEAAYFGSARRRMGTSGGRASCGVEGGGARKLKDDESVAQNEAGKGCSCCDLFWRR